MRRLHLVALVVVAFLAIAILVGASARADSPAFTAFLLARGGPPELALDSADPRAALRASHAPPSSANSIQPSTLISGNLPISTFHDPVSGAADLGDPAVAYNSKANEYLVVWHGYMRGSGHDIYARRVSGAGALPAEAFIVCNATGDQTAPSVAYDAVGDQYWVVWTDARSGTTTRIYVRRLAASGAPIGDEIAVNTSDRQSNMARIACGSGGGCAIVWCEYTDQLNEVYMRGYDAAGNALVAPLLLSIAGGFAVVPDIAYNPTDNQFLAVWAEWVSSSTRWDIVARRASAAFAVLGDAFTVCNTANDQYYPRVAFGVAGGRYALVWQDARSGTDWDIYGQLVTREGNLSGGNLALYRGDYNDMRPAIAAHGSANEFMVVFERVIAGAGQPDIAAFTFGSAGTPSAVTRIRLASNQRYTPGVAHHTGTNEYLVEWADNYAHIQVDIQAQRIQTSRALVGSLLTISAGCKGQENPRIAFGKKSAQYLAVWQDFRSGADYDLYGRMIAANGTLPGAEFAISTAGTLVGDPDVIYNPVRDEFLIAWQDIRNGYEVYARRLSGAGIPLGAEFLISRDTSTGSEGSARLAYNPAADEYLVVWYAFTSGSWNIYSQRLTGAGQYINRNVLVSDSTADELWPVVARNSREGGYLVIWQDNRTGSDNERAHGKRLSDSGALVGSDFPIGSADVALYGLELAYHAQNNEYLALWSQGWDDIVTQRLSAAATNIGGPLILGNSGAQVYPVLGYDTFTQEYVAAWWDDHDDPDLDISGARITFSGAIAERFALATAPDIQRHAALAQNTVTGEFMIIWQDFRAQSWDIYGQRWLNAELSDGAHRTRLPLLLKLAH